MVSTLLAAALIAGQDFPPIQAPTVKRWFVFLNTGPNKAPMTKEESAAGMKGHLGNFNAQYKAGNLDLAGPLGGGTTTRGIIAVRAMDVRGVEALFKADPFVQSKHMVLEIYQMDGPFDRILHPEGDPPMITLTLAIVKKGPGGKRGYRLGGFRLLPSEGKWLQSGQVAFWAKFPRSKTDKLGFFYFFEKDAKKVAEMVNADPMVKDGVYNVELLPQFIGDMFVRSNAIF